VWQATFAKLKKQGFMIVAVAEDSGGAERARPWIEAAHAEYLCLIDTEHRVSDLYGLVNVPQAVWIDERGLIVRPPENPGWTDEWRHNAAALAQMPPEERKTRGRLMTPEQTAARDAGRLAYMAALEDWVQSGRHELAHDAARRALPPHTAEIALAQAHFRLGVWLRRNGRDAEGDRHLAQASRLHPESWTIWRQGAELAQAGGASGTEFLKRMAALGDKAYYPAPGLPGFGAQGGEKNPGGGQ